MRHIADKKLLIILVNILLILIILKVCKIMGFCLTLVDLISPLFFGYIISWIIRPLILFLKNKHINTIISSTIIYGLLIGVLILIGVTLIPRTINDLKGLLPTIEKYLNNNVYLKKLKDLFMTKEVGNSLLGIVNSSFRNIFNASSTIVYSFIISFFLSVNQIKIDNKYLKVIPNKLLNKINKNLRVYVKGTFIDMSILFVMTSFVFLLVKLPSFLLFAFIIALTNVIPYIGPYIGGIPAVLVGFSVSQKLGLSVLIIVVGLQIIENSFIQPLIMSKSLKLNPILIIMGLIIFGHFFGIIGMLLATPTVSVIKIFYDYYKKNKPEWFRKVLGKL